LTKSRVPHKVFRSDGSGRREGVIQIMTYGAVYTRGGR
jgi:hypothetical protein